MTASRRRQRRTTTLATAAATAVVALSVFGVAEAWSSSGIAFRSNRRHQTAALAACLSSKEVVVTTREDTTPLYHEIDTHPAAAHYDFDQYYDTNDSDDDDDDDEQQVDPALLKRFRELQRSTGSEILPSDLQQLVDLGATDFLNQHVQDATDTEKLAMASITEQLPQAAVQALTNNGKKQRKSNAGGGATTTTTVNYKNNLNFAKNKRVTPEQEIALARIIQQGAALDKFRRANMSRQEWATAAGLSPKELRRQVVDYRKAKHDLVTANLGLVHAVVNQMWNQLLGNAKTSGVTREEMVQEGSLGLLRAAELFDPDKGLRFSTYAVVWIKGTLMNSHVPELVRLPAREKNKWNKILQAQKAILALQAGGGDNADGTTTIPVRVSPEEIAAKTGISVASVLYTQRRMSQAQRVLSLDYEYQTQSRSGVDNSQAASVASRMTNTDEEGLTARTQLHADLLAALARNLDAREGRLMRLRYGLSDGRPRTLHECAEAMGLSYTRVHQLAAKCLTKLRQAAEVESLQEYLLTIA